ncbi:unnamed protein product [Phaedon cochleariae]|uniref:Uncharacterized protein n=1 Tax=Phaedon cochleariae TaxID=80249 RepID=A0A9P0DPN1_PHACE|nr:unnamed protein product [Phaedon cochleariae]
MSSSDPPSPLGDTDIPSLTCTPPASPCFPPLSPLPGSSRPKSLMESLLVAKMEQVALRHPGRQLVRTDSADSASSFGSINSATASDVCRCDDCLLGIGDLWQQEGSEERRKKVWNSC